ncbi:Protein kinase [Zostera marina]|uniref:Protein kinase n=1 Tax=Zostera marina TaxID=29655 RepID=A0A0K9PPE2_ZOSMR|nr:Protein kinase [Zostera marina]
METTVTQEQPTSIHYHRHGSNTVYIIAVAIAITVLAVAGASLIVFFLCRRFNNKCTGTKENSALEEGDSTSKNKKNKNSFNSHDGSGNPISSADLKQMKNKKTRNAQVLTYRELEIATEGFVGKNVIGFGRFGVVYKGNLEGRVVAIKMLNREGNQGEREFRVEVDVMSRLDSPDLVGLLGYCADQQHRLLVFEFMANGNLYQHLHQNQVNRANEVNEPKPILEWSTRVRIALDCARALEFLHESTVPTVVIHRDFKCRNILLDENLRAKVSDFGMAKIGSDKVHGQVLTRVLGTTGYVAPEYALTGNLTTKSDVYSYGVVLLELITGRVPVDFKRPPGEQVLVLWALPRLTNRQKLIQMVDPNLQGRFSNKELIQVAAIAAVCVQSESDYRPLMTDVVQSLIPLVKNPNASSLS